MTKKRTQYTDDFRSSAVALLTGAGYPNKLGSLAQVANQLDVPARTLSRWFNGESNPPPDRIVNEKKIDLIKAIDDELKAVVAGLPDARGKASYADLIRAFGTLIDK